MNERSIFAAALDIADAAERGTYLDQACGDNADLRRHLDELLAAQEKLGSFLARPLAQAQATTEGETLSERPGTVIGPYKLMEQIGEGGMGVVFVAEQQHPVRRKVALKLIKPGMDTREVIARFEAERQALALMDHPNIARVFDAGATDSGRPYFVMELVKGAPITDYCDQHQLTPGERLELFVSVCAAVQHAHTKGVIHRDLKPSNILIAPHDGKPVVKVIDFGVAKAIGQPLTDKTIYTRLTQMIGTPLYMSPEQAEVNALDVDTRSDVYALAVLLYELLTGTTPFDHQRFGAAAFDEIRRIIREEEPPRPSTRLTTLGDAMAPASAKRKTELGRLSALVKGDLDWIVMKGLDKDRTRRYETASAFAADVRRYLSEEPVEARPPSAAYRLRKFVKRNRGPVLAASLVLLALVAGVIGTTWGLVRSVQSEGEARLLATKEKAAREQSDQDKAAALLARRQAEASETKAEGRLYASNMVSAHREWEAGNLGHFYRYLKQCQPDLRGWEHDFLYTLANQNQQTLRGHTGGVTCLAYSPDGKRLASASDDNTVKVWDLASRRMIGTIRGRINSMAFSSDGKHLATSIHTKGGRTGLGGFGEETPVYELTVWDATSLKKIWAVEEKKSLGIYSVTFSPGSKLLASASSSLPDIEKLPVGTVRVRDATNGKEIMNLDWSVEVNSLAFSPDGQLLAGGTTSPPVRVPGGWKGGGMGLVKLWDTASGKEIRTFQGHPDSVGSVAFSHDSKRLASASQKFGPGLIDRRTDYTVKVWNVANGKELLTLTGHTQNDTSVAFSPDGKHLAIGLELWEAATGRKIPITFKGHTGRVTSVAFSPDGKHLASASDDSTVKLWDLAGTQEVLTIPAPKPSGTWVMWSAFSPDGKLAIAAGDTVKLFDAASGQEVQTLIKGGPEVGPKGKRFAGVSHLLFSSDGKRLAGLVHIHGELSDTVRVWDAATGQEILSLKQDLTDWVSCVAFSPDGKLLASAANARMGSNSCTFNVWDAVSGKEVLTVKRHAGRILSVAFSPDGKRLATAANQLDVKAGVTDCTVKVWDIAGGKESLTLKGHTGIVHSMAFSPDGKRLATGGGGLPPGYDPAGEVKLWDAAGGQEILTLQGHTGLVRSVAFSPDGKRLATGSMDKTVKLWDAANGQEVLTLKGHIGFFYPIAFSPDGKRLTCTDGDGNAIKIWDASKSMKETDQK